MSKKLKGKVKQVWESKTKQKPSVNTHISYSSFSTFNKCPKLWELQYLRNQVPFTQSIYTCFGTAMHETVQKWLEVMYMESVKKSDELDLKTLLQENLTKSYKSGKAINGHEHFSSPDELKQFWLDGIEILDYLKKNRTKYFSSKTMALSGIETLLYHPIKKNVVFKGLIDLVFYHPNSDTWTIMDIKTSTRGWDAKAKKNPNLSAQVILYKEFFSRQFNIPTEKINVEYFILKRITPKEPMYPAQSSKVQTFNPFGSSSGKNKTKAILTGLDLFIDTVVNEDGSYIDQNYKCKNPLGSCPDCRPFVK